LLKPPGHLCHARLAITLSPDGGRHRVQAVRLVALCVIDQDLLLELLHQEPVAPCRGIAGRFPLAISLPPFDYRVYSRPPCEGKAERL